MVPEQRRWSPDLDPESVAYWQGVVADMEPLSDDAIADVAAILRRIDARRENGG